MASDQSGDTHVQQAALKRAASASFIGNFIEWFDYASYGYLALVIGNVFFPEGETTVKLLSAYAVFAMSFVLRPVGAVVWGWWGDRLGRRWALAWSILIMSGSTFLIGTLPGYAVIGIWAPIGLLVLRMIQGFSASGEYAGAGTFLAEYAPSKHRGAYTALVPASTAAGLLGGALMVAALQHWLNDADMASWGWRVPFLIAGPLGIIGRYIRVHLEDSPDFKKMKEDHEQRNVQQKFPLSKLLRDHTRAVCVGFGVACLNAVAFYLLLAYMPVYVHEHLGIPEDIATMLTTVTLAVYIIFVLLSGRVSDRFGRRTMLLWACGAFTLLSVPIFWFMGTGGILTILVGQVLFALMLTINDGTLATFLSESFPTEVRYSGFALSFNTANALLGGTAPFIATWLISTTGTSLAPAFYLSLVALIAGLTMEFAVTKDQRTFFAQSKV